jgi:hypothetical protein
MFHSNQAGSSCFGADLLDSILADALPMTSFNINHTAIMGEQCKTLRDTKKIFTIDIYGFGLNPGIFDWRFVHCP